MKYFYNGISIQNGRHSNMDSLLLKSRNISGKKALIALVCDGVGSLDNGAFASAVAARMLSEWFSEVTDLEFIGLRMRDIVHKINTYIISEAAQKDFDTATTLTALLLIENAYHIIHIGDSRIYCYENNELSILTTDDISESGKLNAYLGKKQKILLQYYEGIATERTFLLCTDGLYKLMDLKFLKENLNHWNKRPSQETLEVLAQYVIERGEQDNISLALIRIKR